MVPFLKSEQLAFPYKSPETDRRDTTSTFSDNVSLPVHRWFRYSAGFSAIWARHLIEEQKLQGRRRALDPFAGSGTVLLEGEFAGIEAKGVEAHPFISRVAQAKLCYRESPTNFRKFAFSVLQRAIRKNASTDGYPSLIAKCFTPRALAGLDSLYQAWQDSADGSGVSELTWLALVSILRVCSHVGTAQWQYILPKKSKAKVLDPYAAFESKVQMIAGDMARCQQQRYGPNAQLFQEDARTCSSVPEKWADLVITSPPYTNNFDYADAARLELTFLREIRGWGELQEAVRKYLVRSCTQHVYDLEGKTYEMISHPSLDPIRQELTETCRQLEVERQKHGGRKAYHTMISAYFYDMAAVWSALRRVTRNDALVCFVVGDSAPYGIYVPVDKWLGELALNAGFHSYRFEKTRDRNIKWKNRKHRVPLHEGRLWVRR